MSTILNAASLSGKIGVGNYILDIVPIDGGYRLTVKRGKDVQTIDVMNGVGIVKIDKIGSAGNADNYRITLSDGSTFDYSIETDEADRAAAEQERIKSEEARKSNETERKSAEEERAQRFSEYEGEIDRIKEDIDYIHPLAINSFTVTPNMAEKGSTVDSEQFSFKINRIGATMTLEDVEVSGGTATRTDALTADKTYTLSAVLNGVTKSATAAIKFVAPIYYGVGATYELASGTVLSLTRVLTTNRAKTFSVNAADGQYILYALPASLGVPVFKVGGFEGGFTLVGSFDFTNASGYMEAYSLYRSVNSGLGNTTVTVS